MAAPIIVVELVPNEVGIPTEVEVFLLFCGMFPEDFMLPIEDLVMYGMALNLFEDVHNMSQARCRVDGLINIINHRLPPHYLNKLCLWEDKYGNRYVKILDGAHDSAKSVAYKYQLPLFRMIVKGTWPNMSWEGYLYGFSFDIRRINHPVNWEDPKLALLHIQHRKDSESIPDDLFEEIKELIVLSLDAPSLSHSLNVLSNLRMLRVKLLKPENMSCIGGLTNLEFLSISTASLTDIPKEMGRLGNLRLLDLRNMNIAWFPPGVLSKMLKLEELYLPLSFRRWAFKPLDEHDDYDEWGSWEEDDYSEINDGERMNASTSEIVSRLLNALQIIIPKASLLPKKSPLFKNIQKFKILVPNNLKYRPLGTSYSLNVLQLTGDAQDIKESGIGDLMSRTEDLNLTRVRNLKNIMLDLQDCSFPQLQKIFISECDELEYVVDITEKQILPIDDYLFSMLERLHLSMLSNLKEIWHGRRTKFRCFANLSRINIRFCHKLKYVFPMSIIKGCTLLKSIKILDCNELLGIFYQDEEDDNPLVPYSIEELDLYSLPKLVEFLVRMDGKVGVHGGTSQSLTAKEVSLIKCSDIISHMEICCVFPSRLAEKRLQNLERLKIAFCDAVQIIFLFEENDLTSGTFSSLKELEIYGLPNLMHIWFSIPLEIIAFQNLQLLVLSECRNLYLLSPRVAKLLVQLQKVYVSRCEKMEEVMVKGEDDEVEGKIVFPQLKLLELQHIPNLRTFFNWTNPIELPLLEYLKFNQCSEMKSFSYGSVLTPMLKSVEINARPYSILRDGLNATIERYMGNCFETPSDDASSTISSNNPIPGSSPSVYSNDDNSISTISPNGPSPPSLSNTPFEPSTVVSPVTSCSVVSEANEEANSNDQMLSSPIKSGGSTISSSVPTTNRNGSIISSNGPSNNYYDTVSMNFSRTSSAAWRNQFSASASEEDEDANPNCEILETQNYKKEFTFADLKIATKNFSPHNLLGQGGFGHVYMGWLNEKTFAPSKSGTGLAVAIKKVSVASRQGLQEWQQEVTFLERQSHPNLVKLLGHCQEDKELLLVYEFGPRGSLHDHLLGSSDNAELEPLSWDLRLKIAIGVARGLNFLHTSRMEVIHRDIKPTNILLDKDYNAKICDFGLARWGHSVSDLHQSAMNDNQLGHSNDEDSYSTTMLKGTIGFADSSGQQTGRVSVKSDVYSFGLVLLQLMTGSSVIDRKRSEPQHLLGWCKTKFTQTRELKDIIDSRIEGQYSSKAMLLTAELVWKCADDNPLMRPSMRKILKELQKIVALEEDEKD